MKKKTMEINRLPYELVSYQVTTQNIFWILIILRNYANKLTFLAKWSI